MSDSFIVLIPADPHAALPETAEAVRAELADIVETPDSRVKDYGKLQFIDAGQNFERIGCPSCGHTFTIPEWHEWMNADWHGEEGFHLHTRSSPCCATDMTLNDLVYEWPQGFAHWFVGARDVNHGRLTDDELALLQDIAGIGLKPIYQHY